METHHELLIFFLKQKPAYEFMPRLLGSEMCMRDKPYSERKERACSERGGEHSEAAVRVKVPKNRETKRRT